MKHLFLSLVLAIFLPVAAVAADFIAATDHDHVDQGQSFKLQLTLSGVKAKSGPDIDALKKSFTIVSEVQSSNATSINGIVSFSVDWQLTLIPKQAGQLTIPPVTIQTAGGRLRTAPVMLNVEHASPGMPSQISADGSMVSITAKASTTTPYRNQPILYTIRCVVRGYVSGVGLSDISVGNAIVQRHGKPDVYDQVQNGVPVRVVEFHYIITPLQPGKITIPPAVLKGKIGTPYFGPMIDPFGGTFMFSARARQALDFFSSFGGDPFSVASNTTLLDVKPPASAMDPWLPLTSLKITEDIDASQPVRVGEPLTRKITLLAQGAVGGQLPDLDAQQDHAGFRVYADKPTMGQDVDQKTGAISGWRKESYSVMPQKAGQLVLPAIRLTWWDIANNKVAAAELPERVIHVLPGIAVQNPLTAGTGATGKSQTKTAGKSAPVQSSRAQTVPGNVAFALLYGLMGVLAAVLLFLAFWALRLQRKIKRLKPDAPAIVTAKPGPEKPVIERALALEYVRTVEELKDFLQAYAHERLGVSKNASLEKIFSVLPNSRARDKEDGEAIIKGIGAALYAGKAADVEDLKRRFRRIMAVLKSEANAHRKDREKLPLLNPS